MKNKKLSKLGTQTQPYMVPLSVEKNVNKYNNSILSHNYKINCGIYYITGTYYIAIILL